MDLVIALLGLAVVWSVLTDVFYAVVVPRPTPSRYRPSAILVRLTWSLWRGSAPGPGGADGRERRLGIYAPLVVVALLLVWVVSLIVGWGLVFYAIRDQLRPPPADLGAAVYFAGTSLLTIGFGDTVPVGSLARVLAISTAIIGLATVALTITYLFSLYGSLERRELAVTTLDERAGAPPSGVTLLESSARWGRDPELGSLFERWELWAANLLDSHQAHPLLAYFRSSHDQESWVSALGALLDAATLVMTTILDGPRGEAEAMGGIGAHAVEDLARVFALRYDEDCGVERSEFEDAYGRLGAAGYRLRVLDDAWTDFVRTRSRYAGGLNALARHFAVPPALWVSDRSVLPHR